MWSFSKGFVVLVFVQRFRWRFGLVQRFWMFTRIFRILWLWIVHLKKMVFCVLEGGFSSVYGKLFGDENKKKHPIQVVVFQKVTKIR